MKVHLVRLASTHNNLRTDKIEGDCQHLPEVGRLFTMTAPPLDPDGLRREVWTAVVQSIRSLPSGKKIVFKTKNSTYRLEVLE